MTRVVVGFAAGHDAVAIVRAFDDVVIQTIGANVGQRGIPFVIKQTGFLIKGRIRPPDVNAARGHFKLRQNNLDPIGVDVCRCTRLDNFLNGFHARPDARKTAQRNGVDTQI